jgi:preprotein translocase subunit SecG
MWVVVGVVAAVIVVGIILWLQSRKSKGMADKPKPK